MSAGASWALWPTTAQPILRTMDTNSSSGREVRMPGMLSSLSTVPPVCPRPRPLIFSTLPPQAATSGARISVVVSPTPPVECLSTGTPPTSGSSISPDRAMAMVSCAVSSGVMPFRRMAISRADS